MGRVIAVDYGLKRCGLAVTDPLRLIASPLTALPTHEIKAFLSNFVQNEGVDEFVLGLPFTADGGETPLITEIHSFIEWFQKEFPSVKVFQIDEFGTSAEASKALVMAGVPQKKRRDKSNIDMMSAVIILKKHLEEYL